VFALPHVGQPMKNLHVCNLFRFIDPAQSPFDNSLRPINNNPMKNVSPLSLGEVCLHFKVCHVSTTLHRYLERRLSQAGFLVKIVLSMRNFKKTVAKKFLGKGTNVMVIKNIFAEPIGENYLVF
jgi:hypothetical protein